MDSELKEDFNALRMIRAERFEAVRDGIPLAMTRAWLQKS